MSENALTHKLLAWYEKNGRALPWRVKGGAHPNPYVILVSEIMLQQTTVKTVIPYFERFMKRFPTVQDLAAASLEDVYLYWQGLGYYSRARNLHTTARIIVHDLGGKFPEDIIGISQLKGLGKYTVASYLALAFNRPETVIDGNVMRIICRLYHLTDPLEKIRKEIQEKAEYLTDKQAPADYASAIMDLGATICTPKNPQCLLCPWREACLSKDKIDLLQIPYRVKIPKKEIEANVYLIFNRERQIYIRKRTEKGLLSGLYEFPWREEQIFSSAQDVGKSVTHVFTHIRLTLKIWTVEAENPDLDGAFVNVDKLEEYPFSTLMRKVWKCCGNMCVK